MVNILFQQRGRGTWYPTQTCISNIDHHIHSFVYKNEKSIIERTMQYLKDRTNECFDDYFPCRKKECKLKHVKNWLNLFVEYPNKEINILSY